MRDNRGNIVDKFCQSKAIRNTNGVLSKPFVCSTNRMPWTNMRSKAKSAPKSHISKKFANQKPSRFLRMLQLL